MTHAALTTKEQREIKRPSQVNANVKMKENKEVDHYQTSRNVNALNQDTTPSSTLERSQKEQIRENDDHLGKCSKC